MKRIFLFLVTNLFVVVTLSVLLSFLGVDRWLTANGIDYSSLMLFCLVWGMGGAIISLLISRMSAKWMMGVQVINPNQPGEFAWLVNTVHQLSKGAGLRAMPEVGVYESPEINAFATGPSQNRALVAFSTGLLNRMDSDAIAGVAGHEIAHIRNGDMVTMTLLQGVVNAFVMFISRVAAFSISQSVREENRHLVRSLLTFFLDIALTFLGMIVVAWFSRQREFRADRGGAVYAGRSSMISGLQTLQRYYGRVVNSEPEAAIATLKISGTASRLGALFSTHPPLEERIKKLAEMSAGDLAEVRQQIS